MPICIKKNDAEVVDDYRRLETMVQHDFVKKKQYYNLTPKNVHDETCSLLRNAYFAEEIIGEK